VVPNNATIFKDLVFFNECGIENVRKVEGRVSIECFGATDNRTDTSLV
jgi:hypothetical protein